METRTIEPSPIGRGLESTQARGGNEGETNCEIEYEEVFCEHIYGRGIAPVGSEAVRGDASYR